MKNPASEQVMMGRTDWKKKKCFECGELGHVQWRCLKKDDDAEEQKRRANFATAATDEDDRPILLLASTARSLSVSGTTMSEAGRYGIGDMDWG